MENIEHLPGEYTGFLLVSKKIGRVSLDENGTSLVPVHQESMAGNCKLQNWPAYWHEIAIGESHFDAKILPEKYFNLKNLYSFLSKILGLKDLYSVQVTGFDDI